MVQTQCSELYADFTEVASLKMVFCGLLKICLFSHQAATRDQKAAKVKQPLAFFECESVGHPGPLG
jgi:hypothetical protein